MEQNDLNLFTINTRTKVLHTIALTHVQQVKLFRLNTGPALDIWFAAGGMIRIIPQDHDNVEELHDNLCLALSRFYQQPKR